MTLSLLPRHIFPALPAVSIPWLQAQGARLVMLDFDNTIVPYTTDEPSPAVRAWLRQAMASPMQICVVSNSRHGRVVRFCEANGIEYITRARKPFASGIRRCLTRYGVAPSAAVLVGDQIYTDVLGANGTGVRSVLISAIDNHNVWLKLRHLAELPFIWLARKRRVSV